VVDLDEVCEVAEDVQAAELVLVGDRKPYVVAASDGEEKLGTDGSLDVDV
jgi:hypothetical protein